MKTYKNMYRTLLIITFICLIKSVCAEIKLPQILTDNMVLQRETDVNLWGSATPNKQVKVITSWNEAVYYTKSDSKGKWLVKVSTPQAGGPYDILLDDGSKLKLKNILIGDVWLCTGQSNAEMPMAGFFNQPVNNSLEEIVASSKYPIRFVTLKRNPSETVQTDCPTGGWLVTSAENTPKISASAYFFAKQMTESLGIPIGLISTNRGASRMEAWMSPQAVSQVENVPIEKYAKSKSITEHPYKHYNGMIAPITNYTAKGFIWIHGSANRFEWYQYADLMTNLIKQWRTEWKNDNMPFVIVQKTHFSFQGEDDDCKHVLVMEEQLKATSRLPNVSIVPTSDVVDYTYIHQSQKDVIGQRIAYTVLKNYYGYSSLHVDPPLIDAVKYEGGKAIVSFKNATFGLYPSHEAVLGFEIAGEDRVFYPAHAKIITIYPNETNFPKDKEENQWFFDLHDHYLEVAIELASEKVLSPIAVRYGFRNKIEMNLTNIFGIPAYPFRTDDWIERKSND